MTVYRMRLHEYRMNRDRDEEGRPRNARPRDRFGRPLPRGARDELGMREEPEEVVASAGEAFARAVALYDERRFFEAHEFLEYVWKAESTASGDRAFWKGVTQVAVGCCHTQRGNTIGALRLLERALAQLAGYPARHRGVDVDGLRRDAGTLITDVRRHGASPAVPFPPFPRSA